ncbi:hypothetical protein LEP1GSC133_1061 [Leptospira borgpetersenii serovar Pomona str. 200901868]|uniref:Uncharacterized protein n=1 Tax=Leptospira borgpetersenii serovar Pomona str. 200901868 TaxID=1192866 RepID=M6W2R3_LEPBO|nr:hypothetical protein LEP1GSC133_1061 [Leptospira borgpetersenii serovar Pomona str. 200901868]
MFQGKNLEILKPKINQLLKFVRKVKKQSCDRYNPRNYSHPFEFKRGNGKSSRFLFE